jgi:hypothetical protein
MWDLNDILWDNLRTNNIMIWCVWNHHHSAWKWRFRVYCFGLTALLTVDGWYYQIYSR